MSAFEANVMLKGDLVHGGYRSSSGRMKIVGADLIAANVRQYIDGLRASGELDKMSAAELADEILLGFGVL